jgi:hypothetical protein
MVDASSNEMREYLDFVDESIMEESLKSKINQTNLVSAFLIQRFWRGQIPVSISFYCLTSIIILQMYCHPLQISSRTPF